MDCSKTSNKDHSLSTDLLSEVETRPISPLLPLQSTTTRFDQSIPISFYTTMISTMQQMADKLATPQSQVKIKISDLFLPSFDPDGDINIADWCKHIRFAKEKYNFEEYDIRMKATSLLKGRARKWADRWLVTTSTWEELEQNLIMTFEPEKRYSRDILKFRDHKFDTSKDISEFLSTSWFLWRKITKNKLLNEDAVEAVIGTIDDERIRMELLNARAKSVPELISVASCIRLKRPNLTISENQLPKRKVGHDQLHLAPNPGQQINVSAVIRNTDNPLRGPEESPATETIGSSTDTGSEIGET